MKEVMRRVKDARKRSGLTQAEIAQQLGLTTSGYNNYETLVRTMSISDLCRLPAILRCKITDLLPASIVTPEDVRRAKDHDLEKITKSWSRMTPKQRSALITTWQTFELEEGED